MKTIKKILAITLTLAMVITIAPSMTNVKAGGGVDISGLPKGINTDNTIDVGAVLKVSKSELQSTMGTEFMNRMENGKAGISWVVTKNGISPDVVESITPKLNGAYYTFEVTLDYVGLYFYLCTYDEEDTANNNNTMAYKVNSAEVHILQGPTFGNITASNSFLKKNITVYMNGYGIYTINSDPKEYYIYEKIVKLYRNGKLIDTKKTKEYEVGFKNVPVSYGKKDNFKVTLSMKIGNKEVVGATKTFQLSSQNIPNIKAYATKISKKKAYLRWQSVGGVTGYYIYMGKKKVKTVGAKTNKKMITKKKAGKSKFKVIPFVRVSGKVYKSSSNAAKPKKNQVKWSRNLNVKSYGYATCPFVVTKISLSGKTYTVTGYALNNRMWKVKKYKSLTVGLRVDGKKAFNKKFKNKKLNIKEYKKKKIVLKIKGKAGADLANGSVSLSVGQNPDWGVKNDPFKD